MPEPRRPEGGFLLLEVLVAFAIAALALAVLFQGAVAGLRATETAGRYEQAVARARSHLAALGGRAPHFVPGVATGDDGSGFRWQTHVTPAGSLTIAGPPPERILLYRVSVTESWSTGHGTRREVRLTTARLEEEASATP